MFFTAEEYERTNNFDDSLSSSSGNSSPSLASHSSDGEQQLAGSAFSRDVAENDLRQANSNYIAMCMFAGFSGNNGKLPLEHFPNYTDQIRYKSESSDSAIKPMKNEPHSPSSKKIAETTNCEENDGSCQELLQNKTECGNDVIAMEDCSDVINASSPPFSNSSTKQNDLGNLNMDQKNGSSEALLAQEHKHHFPSGSPPNNSANPEIFHPSSPDLPKSCSSYPEQEHSLLSHYQQSITPGTKSGKSWRWFGAIDLKPSRFFMK